MEFVGAYPVGAGGVRLLAIGQRGILSGSSAS
jgi:hypothetical protein